MTLARRRLWSVLPLALVAALALVHAGCGTEEGVTKTEVPKEPDESPNPKPRPGGGDSGAFRILGAMIPHDEPQVFLKFSGPTEELEKYVADFDKVLASVALVPKSDPTFDVPAGWKKADVSKRQFVIAALRTPDDKYEITVSSAAGDVQMNLKRWASDPGQLGGKFNPADIPKLTKVVDAKGVKALRVDLRGPKDPRGKMMGGK